MREFESESMQSGTDNSSNWGWFVDRRAEWRGSNLEASVLNALSSSFSPALRETAAASQRKCGDDSMRFYSDDAALYDCTDCWRGVSLATGRRTLSAGVRSVNAPWSELQPSARALHALANWFVVARRDELTRWGLSDRNELNGDEMPVQLRCTDCTNRTNCRAVQISLVHIFHFIHVSRTVTAWALMQKMKWLAVSGS